MHSGISTCCNMYIALEVYMLYVYPTFKRNKKAQKNEGYQKIFRNVRNYWITNTGSLHKIKNGNSTEELKHIEKISRKVKWHANPSKQN